MDCVWVTWSSLCAAQLRGSQVQTALCVVLSGGERCDALQGPRKEDGNRTRTHSPPELWLWVKGKRRGRVGKEGRLTAQGQSQNSLEVARVC